MMKKLFSSLLISMLLCSLLLSGCSSASGSKEVSIELEENPTTGYEWAYTIEPEGILTETYNQYDLPKTDAVGAGGKHTWKFSGAKDGDVTLTFKYSRSWEPKEDDEVKTYQYTVANGNITEKK